MKEPTFKDDLPRHPYEHAKTCTTVSSLIGIALLVIGGIVANIGHARFEDAGVDWTTFGLWAGAAGITLTIGQCTAAICRQLADFTADDSASQSP